MRIFRCFIISFEYKMLHYKELSLSLCLLVLIGCFCLIDSVDLSLVSFNWFLTVFVDSFPIQVCCVVFVSIINALPLTTNSFLGHLLFCFVSLTPWQVENHCYSGNGRGLSIMMCKQLHVTCFAL